MIKRQHLKGWCRALSLLLSGVILFAAVPSTVYAQEAESVQEETYAPGEAYGGQEDEVLEETQGNEEPSGVEETVIPEETVVPEETVIPEETVMTEEKPDEITLAIQELDREVEAISFDHDILALVYMCESYDVKTAPLLGAENTVTVGIGQTVMITGIEYSDNTLWYEVKFGLNDSGYTGYIQKEYLVFSDEALIQAEEQYLPENVVFIPEVRGYADIDYFPVSYRKFLTELKNSHPNWTFVPMNTNLDWNEVVVNEMYKDRSLVPANSDSSWIRGYYSNSWSLASEGILKHYLDPRNYLNDTNIFAFEQLTYNPSYHVEPAVQNILNSTFMAGEIPGEGRTYANAFWEIGNSLGVSPFHLACRVYQEQGRGTSPLISGTYSGYEGLYNYFNIGASGATNEAIYTSGLKRARDYGWTTRFASLYGGAQIISQNYILKGQDTLYLQKFDVDPSYHGLYAHQYMQNIMAPTSESASIKRAYANAGSVDNVFVFKIPVYNNMPSTRCVKPGQPEEPEPIIPVDRTAVTNFVTRLYTVALGRTPDEAGLNSWVDIISNRENTGAQAAYGFIFSDELKGRNLDDAAYVELLYRTLFDRSADEVGKSGWLNILSNGLSREYVFKGFVDSAEFDILCSGYGIDRGTIGLSQARDQNEGVTKFVARCYRQALGREYETDGLESWCRVILNGSNTPKQAAQSFIFSDEFKQKNLSNEEYVKILYRTFMDREADEVGLRGWTAVLDSGRENRVKVLDGFADSAEFAEIMAQYGLK